MKTSELIDLALDWAVAKCEGYEYNIESGLLYKFKEPHFFKPYSTDWSQGGPIIEREWINISRAALGGWVSTLFDDTAELLENSFKFRQYGPTPLIAAMRCYVASKLGEEIDVPKELL